MRSLVNDLQRFANGTRYSPPLRYAPNFAELSPLLLGTFEPSTRDAETCEFLDHSANELSLVRLLMADVMRCLGISRTTANGLLGVGGMFVLSTEQCRRLLRPPAAIKSSPTSSAPHHTGREDGEEAGATPSDMSKKSSNKSDSIADNAAAKDGKVVTSGMDLIPSLPPSHRFAALLDIGAGDGGATAKVAPLFGAVYATEYSMSMRYRLRQRGYSVLDHEDPFHYNSTVSTTHNTTTTSTAGATGPNAKAKGSDEDEHDAPRSALTPDPNRRFFDVISCLNVLDRADKPLTLLRDMRDSLTPNGLLVLAVVLPWCPFVEFNAEQRVPTERLPMEGGLCCRGASFEESANKLVENVLLPCGFELVRWTKVPYLCMGNLRVEYAVLHDAVFILKRKPDFKDTAHTVSAVHRH